MNLIEKRFYSIENAAKNLNLEFMEDDLVIGINQSPCVKGMVMSEADKVYSKSIGISLSHPATCF